MRRSIVWALGAALLGQGALAVAEQQLVTVELSQVQDRLAHSMNLSERQIPATVSVPIVVAERVCDVDASLLEREIAANGGIVCTAVRTSSLLREEVKAKLMSPR